MDKENINTQLALICFFGWLLSFPFSGPILEGLPLEHHSHTSLALIFLGSHGLSLLVAGFIIDELKAWKHLIQLGALICVISHTYLLLTGFKVFPQGAMAVMGISSALFVLGWSRPYSLGIRPEHRIRTMAGMIIAANIILLLSNLSLMFFSPTTVLTLSLLLLVGSLGFSRNIPDRYSPGNEPGSLPSLHLFLVTLFILLIYINGGFLYTLVHRTIDPVPIFHHLRILVYIGVLAVMWLLGSRVKDTVLIYLGASVMGVAFVLFALFARTMPGSAIITLILEGAFGFIDLFTWTVSAAIAFVYKRSFRVFGAILSANVAAIFCGYLWGGHLIVKDQYQITTGLFASAIIFLAFLLVPWMKELIDKGDCSQLSLPQPVLNQQLRGLTLMAALTPREIEILAFLLEGHRNKTIAMLLHISENTLKTHLKSIYAKLGISHKRELFSLISTHQNGA